VKQILH